MGNYDKDKFLEEILEEFGPLAERLAELEWAYVFSHIQHRTVKNVLRELEYIEVSGKYSLRILVKESTRRVLHHKKVILPKEIKQEITNMGYTIGTINIEPHLGKPNGYYLLELSYLYPEELEEITS